MKIHYSTSAISSGSLDIHSKRSDHWRYYPCRERRQWQIEWKFTQFFENNHSYPKFTAHKIRYSLHHSPVHTIGSLFILENIFILKISRTLWIEINVNNEWTPGGGGGGTHVYWWYGDVPLWRPPFSDPDFRSLDPRYEASPFPCLSK